MKQVTLMFPKACHIGYLQMIESNLQVDNIENLLVAALVLWSGCVDFAARENVRMALYTSLW